MDIRFGHTLRKRSVCRLTHTVDALGGHTLWTHFVDTYSVDTLDVQPADTDPVSELVHTHMLGTVCGQTLWKCPVDRRTHFVHSSC